MIACSQSKWNSNVSLGYSIMMYMMMEHYLKSIIVSIFHLIQLKANVANGNAFTYNDL